MKIDSINKELQLSIRELASTSDNNKTKMGSSIPSRLKTTIGQEVHQNYQKRVTKGDESSKSEYYIKFNFLIDDWKIEIRGRADVVYEKTDKIIIEEIKSVSSLSSSDSMQLNSSHILQLQLYGHYFISILNKKEVQCFLIIYNLISDNYEKIEIESKDMTEFIDEQCKAIIEWHDDIEINNKKLSKRYKSLKFPFQSYRSSQEDIIQNVSTIIKNQGRLLLLAPSGLGKTIGTLYPSMKYALENNMRIFVATSKTTQQKIYRDTLKLMSKKKGRFKSIILTAKEKICNNTEFMCELCGLIINYTEKNLDSAVDSILKRNVISARSVKKVANNNQVCAFELSLDVSLKCDVIVGDYNYIFHPQIRLRRFFNVPYKDSILIIDEVHNLPARANEYYSPKLILKEITYVITDLQSSILSKKVISEGKNLLQRLYQYIISFEEDIVDFNKWRIGTVEIQEKKINSIQKSYDLFIIEYIREFSHKFGKIPDITEPILRFGDQLKHFNSILKESKSEEFSHLYYADEGILKILCKSASKKLAQQIKGFHSVIGQSATLYPLEYYKNTIGFPNDAKLLEYPSPFPEENSLHLVYPSVSTKYQARAEFYCKIAELMIHAINCKEGNYLAFFPSFSFLKEVYQELVKFDLHFKILVQENKMSERKRRKYLKILQNGEAHLLLGVHGGIFSESVDFIGDMGIGVFIIGPGLPAYTFEQELMKEYFQNKWNKGFEYAYRNPGMNKVIQAAGRIFRSSDDKGIVILVGYRFNTPYYSSILPKDWNVIATPNPIEYINDFWEERHDQSLDGFWND